MNSTETINIKQVIEDARPNGNAVEFNFAHDPTFHSEPIVLRVEFHEDALELVALGLRFSRYDLMSGEVDLDEAEDLIGHAIDEFGQPEVSVE